MKLISIYTCRAETLKLQLLIKAQKSLVIDSEGLARDSHMLSKQLYLWACDEPDHALKDVGDRLAYMNYQLGDLQQQYAQKMETSRSDLKEIRNLEVYFTLTTHDVILCIMIFQSHPSFFGFIHHRTSYSNWSVLYSQTRLETS
jgi:hypothetical protein